MGVARAQIGASTQKKTQTHLKRVIVPSEVDRAAISCALELSSCQKNTWRANSCRRWRGVAPLATVVLLPLAPRCGRANKPQAANQSA